MLGEAKDWLLASDFFGGCYLYNILELGFIRRKSFCPLVSSWQMISKLCSLTRYEVFCSISFGVSTTMASEEYLSTASIKCMRRLPPRDDLCLFESVIYTGSRQLDSA